MVWKTRLSWGVFVLGGLIGLGSGGGRYGSTPAWVNALTNGYVLWALFWGLPVVWGRRHSIVDRLNRWVPMMGCMTKWALYLSIFWAWALLFSVFGGGLHQFVQQARINRGA